MKLRTLFPILIAVSVVAPLCAEEIPLTDWTVPPYRASSDSGGLTTMTDVTDGIAFVGVAPCRIVDTRLLSGFPPAYGAPALAAGQPRNFDLNSAPHCAGIPSGVQAYSLNITVTNTQGPGFILIYPQGGAQPTVSTLNYLGGQTVANAAIVPAASNGGVTVIAGVSGTDLIIDINGYFTPFYNAATAVIFDGNRSNNWFMWVANHNLGLNTVGIQAVADSLADGSAGIRARVGQGALTQPGYAAAGVRGEGPDYGVLGISLTQGVAGSLLSLGSEVAWGALGDGISTDPGCPSSPCGGPWGVFAGGNIGATGAKFFLEPHPTDASMVVGYISLEGPEAGTYFRGRAKFQNGIAKIAVPEHFRWVTDPEGLTVQITPIGEMASFAVVKMDLSEIVVKASRNVEFSYLVQGVRASFKDTSPVFHAREFMPRSPDATVPQWLTATQRRLLVQNGTYREDGTVNRETAQRLGWDRIWSSRERPAPEPAP